MKHRSAVLRDPDLALGARVLAELIGSGLTVSRALQVFGDLAPRSWKAFLPRLRDGVRGGSSLSAALKSLDGAVPPLFVAMVRAGEAGGTLAASLDSVATLYESTAASRAALLSALTYPAFLFVVCLGSISLLGGVVLPRFAALLTELGQRLPTSTALLVSASMAARSWSPVLVGASVVAVTAAWYWATRPPGQARWHALLLRTPLVGQARHAWASASVCATTGALVQSGVLVTAALQHASSTCADAAVAARVAAARQHVLAGSRPSDALLQLSALTPTALQLLRAGEESGKVAPMLLRAAQLERSRAMRVLQATLRLIEPTLVIAFGGLVAFVATALLQAVYAIRPGS